MKKRLVLILCLSFIVLFAAGCATGEGWFQARKVSITKTATFTVDATWADSVTKTIETGKATYCQGIGNVSISEFGMGYVRFSVNGELTDDLEIGDIHEFDYGVNITLLDMEPKSEPVSKVLDSDIAPVSKAPSRPTFK